jgi:peptidoglycan/LPS O-acetylase OafA/YrhL
LFTLVFVQRRHGVNAKDVLAHVFLVHNLSQSTIFGINIPFWSLAAEAQLYLMYPIFLWLRKHYGIWGALGRVLLVTVLARIPAAWGTDWDADLRAAHWQSPVILWLDWCLGALAAELHYKQRLAACGQRRLVICLGALFCASTFFKVTNTFSFTLASLFWTIVLGRYLVRKNGVPKWERLLIPAGLCSYSLYLWHFPIQRQLLGLLPKIGIQQGTVAFMVVGFLVTVPVALGVSWFLYKAVERPGIALGHRLKYAARWPALTNVLFQKQKS